MLNLVTFDIDDQKLLEESYNAIQQKNNLTIITNTTERKKIFTQTINAIKIPNGAEFSFQNLFKISLQKGKFYIAQCIINYNYPLGRRGSQTFDHNYHYCAVGIANLTTNLGITNLRSETQIDKVAGYFFDADIDFEYSEKF